MPNVDLAHVHESKRGQAGLLLTLSVLSRAAHLIQRLDTEPGNQAAREHLGIYQDVLTSWQRSA